MVSTALVPTTLLSSPVTLYAFPPTRPSYLIISVTVLTFAIESVLNVKAASSVADSKPIFTVVPILPSGLSYFLVLSISSTIGLSAVCVSSTSNAFLLSESTLGRIYPSGAAVSTATYSPTRSLIFFPVSGISVSFTTLSPSSFPPVPFL